MKLRFYDFEKRINSTKQPNGISYNTISCFLKEGCSIYNPVFTLYTDPRQSNYIYWEEIGRYYYIDDITIDAQNLYTISCSIDVLASWKYDIVNTYAFVEYAQSTYNPMIPDGRLSTMGTAVYSSSNAKLFDFNDLNNMAYVVTYVASQPNIGGSGVVVMSGSALRDLVGKVSDAGYVNFIESSLKSLMGIYDCLLKCIALPYTPSGQNVWEIYLSGYDTGLVGATPDFFNTYECDVTIPWQYSDFRNMSGYTSMLMVIPTVGCVELNPNDFIGKNSIHVKAVCDNISGDVVIYIGNDQMKVTSNIATEIAIGTVKNNGLGVLSSILTAPVAAAASGSIIGAGGSVAGSIISGSIASLQRQNGVIGSNGSYISSVSGSVSRGYVELILISHNTNVEPSNLASTIGRPDFSSHMLGDLSGYCKCNNASVDCNAPTELKNRINDFLNGGFIIE